jgi:predicted metal-dependent enzyme (double-stranded beta helix superfamily)
MIAIDKLVEGLRAIPDPEFTCDGVYGFLAANPIETRSLERFLHWSPEFYTRNLIYRDDRFEIMAICWESGQVSRIHDHAGQLCWMTVPIGKLHGQNYAISEIDESKGLCRLRETTSFDLSDCLTAKVELEEPIHQIINPAEFGQRAVSVHIYSKPFEKCLSFCRETDTFKEVTLCYTSIDGKLCNGIAL